MTQDEGAEGTHVPPPPAAGPAFRFNGYGVPVDAEPAEPDAPDDNSPYRYDAYGPQLDPYVDDVPYDEPLDPYVRNSPYDEPPAEPPADPYVEHVPYDEPVDPYVANVPYDEPVDPYVANVPYDEPVVARASQPEPPPRPAEPQGPPEPAAPIARPEPVARPEPIWSPPTPEPEPEPAAPEPEPVFVARLQPVVEPPPSTQPAPPPRPAPPLRPAPTPPPPAPRPPTPPPTRRPAIPDLPWRAEVPLARFEPEPPRAPEQEPRPVSIGSAAYAEPYVHAYVAAEAPVEALARPAPVTWPPPTRRPAPARARTDEPAVVARPAYRPATHAPARTTDETRERTWALISHIGGLLTGFVVPLVTFLVYRKRSQFLREHTTEALNFQLMLTIVYAAGAALTVLFFGVFVLAAAWVFAVTFGTLGALAANDGDRFRYPVNLRVIA